MTLFGFGALLSKFFGVPTADAPYYLVAFAAGNLIGPLVLARLFDTVGRKPMIAGTYILSGALLLVTSFLFKGHHLSAGTLTACWAVVFFFASAGVSAAYLTVSEIFPMETRALAIAVFYALGTGIGGIIGPLVFTPAINSGSYGEVFRAMGLGAILMILGGLIEIAFGVKAERRRLEGIAKPLTAVESAVRSGVARAGAASAAGAARLRPGGGTAASTEANP
jgi:MFS family permease